MEILNKQPVDQTYSSHAIIFTNKAIWYLTGNNMMARKTAEVISSPERRPIAILRLKKIK